MAGQPFNFDAEFGARYDQFVRTTIFGYDSLFKMILALFQTRLGAEARVLDVGCGTGSAMLAWGQAMPGWTFTGVDPSAQMLQQCRAKLEQAGLSDRVELRHGYAGDLPAGEQYDAAAMVLVMHFIPDNGAKLALLHAIGQRLKPGGSLVLIDHHGDTGSATFQHLMSAWINYDILMGLPPDRARTIPVEASTSHHFITEARTLQLLSQAGFEEVERFYGAFVTGGWLARKR